MGDIPIRSIDGVKKANTLKCLLTNSRKPIVNLLKVSESTKEQFGVKEVMAQ